MSDIISAPEAARLIGVSLPTLHNWRKNPDRFPDTPQPVSHHGNHQKYSRRQVEAWLRKHNGED
ncbi:helix-turn-helix transcriptional regulator [Erwinia sp. ACCC 02193]|uniref:Helix-turn-helix transcriptional regulator n=1 Tax=Erwinia aeris TaxID=3239803 RepID=A0ABV4EEP2_9GAMM